MQPIKAIIHIDDDADDRMWVKTLIEDLFPSLELMQFAGGDEALFYLMHLDDAIQPSLILLDLNMPKLDGKMVLKQLEENKKLSTIPVVLFTTSNSELDKSFARKHNVRLVTKPPTITSLAEALKNIMELAL